MHAIGWDAALNTFLLQIDGHNGESMIWMGVKYSEYPDDPEPLLATLRRHYDDNDLEPDDVGIPHDLAEPLSADKLAKPARYHTDDRIARSELSIALKEVGRPSKKM
jgi:hypothetical protein